MSRLNEIEKRITMTEQRKGPQWRDVEDLYSDMLYMREVMKNALKEKDAAYKRLTEAFKND